MLCFDEYQVLNNLKVIINEVELQLAGIDMDIEECEGELSKMNKSFQKLYRVKTLRA